MRNDNYKEDQLIFRFINSERCNSYKDLKAFVIENELLLYERWVFYLYGRRNFFTPNRIIDFEDNGRLNYGAHIFSEVFWWSEFLKEEEAELRKIDSELSDAKLPFGNRRKILAKKGWVFVQERLQDDYQMESEMKERDDFEEARSEYPNDVDNNYCHSCQMNPCMCSDIEKTSTTFS